MKLKLKIITAFLGTLMLCSEARAMDLPPLINNSMGIQIVNFDIFYRPTKKLFDEEKKFVISEMAEMYPEEKILYCQGKIKFLREAILANQGFRPGICCASEFINIFTRNGKERLAFIRWMHDHQINGIGCAPLEYVIKFYSMIIAKIQDEIRLKQESHAKTYPFVYKSLSPAHLKHCYCIT